MEKKDSVEFYVGKRIKRLRKMKKMTQQEFSEVIGISTNYLSEIECGKCSVRLEKLALIMNALGCSADDLFADVVDFGSLIRASRYSDRIAQLSPEDQRKLFAVMEAFLDTAEKEN